jgi:YHS domain-containing protein
MKTAPLFLAAVIAMLTAAPVATQAAEEKAPAAAAVPADYPLKTCPVSGEALGEMGKPVKVTHNGTDVYLCCKSCAKDFKKDPDKFTKMVTDAAAKKKS